MNTDEQRSIEASLKRVEFYARRTRRSLWWSGLGVLIALGSLVGVLILNSTAKGGGYCHPADAYAIDVRYVPAGDNTAIKLQVWCPGGSAEWYVSFFTGDQPTLRQWAEIQNTASELLRGDSDE